MHHRHCCLVTQQIPMPTTSSIDYIKAGIADIVHALQFPSPNSPLAPLSDSHSKALQLLMLILHGTTNPNQPAMAPAASLRVAANTPFQHASPVVDPSVPATPAPTNSPCMIDSTPVLPVPTAVEPSVPAAPATSLRVDPPATHPDDATIPTDNHMKSKFQPPPTVTMAPQTRSQFQPCHSPHLHALYAKQHPPSDPVCHAAFHGNTFNPDTGELAEYKELSTSSDGKYWQQANTTEIHCLAQGTASVPRTNTMFFIPVLAIPKGCCATYLCIVCAH